MTDIWSLILCRSSTISQPFSIDGECLIDFALLKDVLYVSDCQWLPVCRENQELKTVQAEKKPISLRLRALIALTRFSRAEPVRRANPRIGAPMIRQKPPTTLATLGRTWEIVGSCMRPRHRESRCGAWRFDFFIQARQ